MDVSSPADRETVEAIEGSFLTQVGAGERMSVQHFRVKPGSGAPEHSHEHEEVIYTVEGAYTVAVDGEEYTVEAGEVFLIPGGERHSSWNPGAEPAVGLMVFSPPRPRPPDLED